MPATHYETLKKITREMTQKEIVDRFGEGPYKLNLGCGSDIRQGYINIDCIDTADIEDTSSYLQLDLEVARLPFPKGSVEEILAYHVMEHLHAFPKLMNECHRVLKHNGSLIMHVPCYPSVEAFQDPTHVRFFTHKTPEYFLKGAFLYEHCGKSYGFEGWRNLKAQMAHGWELQMRFIR